jgi:hypothetical protein
VFVHTHVRECYAKQYGSEPLSAHTFCIIYYGVIERPSYTPSVNVHCVHGERRESVFKRARRATVRVTGTRCLEVEDLTCSALGWIKTDTGIRRNWIYNMYSCQPCLKSMINETDVSLISASTNRILSFLPKTRVVLHVVHARDNTLPVPMTCTRFGRHNVRLRFYPVNIFIIRC